MEGHIKLSANLIEDSRTNNSIDDGKCLMNVVKNEDIDRDHQYTTQNMHINIRA